MCESLPVMKHEIEILAPTPEIAAAVIASMAKAGLHAVDANAPEESNELENAIAETKADEARIGTPDYQGRAYFWHYDLRHYLRDCSDERRREVHAALLAAGLPLDGTSPAHEKIICIEP